MTCAKCGKPATKRFSPDLDIDGLGACDVDIEDVRLAYTMLLQGSEDMFRSFTKKWAIAQGKGTEK